MVAPVIPSTWNAARVAAAAVRRRSSPAVVPRWSWARIPVAVFGSRRISVVSPDQADPGSHPAHRAYRAVRRRRAGFADPDRTDGALGTSRTCAWRYRSSAAPMAAIRQCRRYQWEIRPGRSVRELRVAWYDDNGMVARSRNSTTWLRSKPQTRCVDRTRVRQMDECRRPGNCVAWSLTTELR